MSEIATRYGLLQAFEPENDLICRCLSKYGEWGQYEVRFVASNLASGSRVADIGAFLGTFGLGLSQLVDLGGLCFVEANAHTAQLLSKNVATHSTVPSHVVEAVVGPFAGVRDGAFVPGNMGTFSVVDSGEDARTAGESVGAVRSLKSLADQYGPFGLYKIDVEGAERHILSAERDFLAASDASLWLECNETFDSLEVLDLLLSMSYDVYYFAFPAIADKPFFELAANEFPFAYEAGLWATRGAAPRLDAALREAGCVLDRVANRDALRSVMWRTPRWAPHEWDKRTRSEIVALAVHALSGDTFDNFLLKGPEAGAKEVVQPSGLKAMRHKLADVENRLSDTAARLRASNILLFEERSRSAAVVQRLESELSRIRSIEQQHAAMLRSASWRVTMPLRMLALIARGDWSTLKRVIRTKLSHSRSK